MTRQSSRPLHVAHVTLGLEVGGQEKLLVEFARHADAARVAGHVISLSGRGPLAEEIEDQGWPVTALDEPPGLRPRLVWRLARLFRRLGADVVHTHDDKPLLYGAFAARIAGVRRVIHTHHHGKLSSVSRRQERLTAWASRGVDRFVCVAHENARQMAAYGVAIRRIRVLWNGIDLERFSWCGPAAEGPVVAIARLSPEKDVANLLRAMAIVVRDHSATRLEIAGDGPCREELLRLAAELRLGQHVKFLGEERDIPNLLARASLFVLPSQTEGISLTLLEAMARGLPVIATRVGGNPEVVGNGVTGLLVPPRDPAALAETIVRLRATPENALAMGKAGRERAAAHFDIRRVVRRYEAMYERQNDGEMPSLDVAAPAREVQPCAS